ncbi:hypothetical protein Q5P01_010602 [Channa striata]|uniref:Endonuclease/exonuclease/phosphatase domain-containing protein n=1 Tax=Channa striata TaxID=64152 RepID=A0AA88MXU2_CHASR|nr:hypothetical protein Q5P01_010602 [Channa striata]
MCFTETWLSDTTPDSVVNLEGFKLVRADRGWKESGKRKGGGLAVFINERWCNPKHVCVKEQLCTKDIEFVAVGVRPYYILREFSHVIVFNVYVPPLDNAAAACELLHGAVTRLQTQHPQALLLISGDFNHASLSSTLPTFTQYVKCRTRNNKTLDLLYANVKDAYTSSPLPPLGRSDRNLVHLRPEYTPRVRRQPAQTKTVKLWTDEAYERLRDCFETTDWDTLCSSHGDDINSLTH